MASPYLQRSLQYFGQTINDYICLGLFDHRTLVVRANRKSTHVRESHSFRSSFFIHITFRNELFQLCRLLKDWNR